jgi:hypothetical protein
MASVITSARSSSAALFDMFGDTANAASKLIKTASRSIDALDAKADLMTHSVIIDSKARKDRASDRIAKEITLETIELEQSIHNITQAGTAYDFKANYDRILKEVQAAIAA